MCKKIGCKPGNRTLLDKATVHLSQMFSTYGTRTPGVRQRLSREYAEAKVTYNGAKMLSFCVVREGKSVRL